MVSVHIIQHKIYSPLTMTHTQTADQVGELLLVKDISDHTVSFTLVETTLCSTSNDTSGILFYKMLLTFAMTTMKSMWYLLGLDVEEDLNFQTNQDKQPRLHRLR